MSAPHHRFWPKGLPARLQPPVTTLYFNLQVAAERYPDKPAIVFYDSITTYAELRRDVDAVAGYLYECCNVRTGDRVLLFAQNCPQFIAAYYGILRAGAVVVPVNAMSTATELDHYVSNSGAKVVIVAQELYEQVKPLMFAKALDHAVVLRYADCLKAPTTLELPDVLLTPVQPIEDNGVASWSDALGRRLAPPAATVHVDDLCVLPYTSGTTGRSKGCMHTHRTVMHAAFAAQVWRQLQPASVFLSVAPMFHVLGMQNGMNVPILLGATIVMLTRWNAGNAAALIERYGVSVWAAPPAMVLDFFSLPDLNRYDLSSLALLCGGGAAMPEAVASTLKDKFGIVYSEAYGLSETASFLHSNPLWRPKRQCIGMPTFGVDSRIIDPETRLEVPSGEIGEIVTSAAQVMLGYWRNPQADADSFIELDGKRFFRTGDLGYVDEDGYFFMRDRLKRMINVSGYKVWPAEVESMMYLHPAIHEVCVIAVKDTRGNERVKAVVAVKPDSRGSVSKDDILAWCRMQMAAYKVPREIEFVDSLPKSASGKILWRELQEQHVES